METRRDVFQAIADPTRRQIIGMIAENPMNLNSIAENFESSRQAVSLHIKILQECGLITVRKQGRERYCVAKLEELNVVHEWLEQYRTFWIKNLQTLKDFLEEDQSSEASPEKKKRKSKKSI